LLISLILAPRSSADQAVGIDKGQPAPFSGVLMDQEKANAVKIGLQERDLYKQIVDSQSRSLDLLKQNNTYAENKVNLLLEQNDKLAERLQSAQSLNNWERVGLVILGMAFVLGGAYAVKGISK
jgi:hypothetical protein